MQCYARQSFFWYDTDFQFFKFDFFWEHCAVLKGTASGKKILNGLSRCHTNFFGGRDFSAKVGVIPKKEHVVCWPILLLVWHLLRPLRTFLCAAAHLNTVQWSKKESWQESTFSLILSSPSCGSYCNQDNNTMVPKIIYPSQQGKNILHLPDR